MHIVVISDTHNQLGDIDLPHGDLLVHCGDATNSLGSKSVNETAVFCKQLNKASEKFPLGCVFVPGNHDRSFKTDSGFVRTLLSDDVIVASNDYFAIEGYNIYCSSMHPLKGWPFAYKTEEEAERRWETAPRDVDILITHSPPYGVLDTLRDGTHLGCTYIRDYVFEVRPKVHLFGHIHEGYGTKPEDGIMFVNAAMCDEYNKLANKPIVMEIL